MTRECLVSGKSKLTLNNAKSLIRRCVDLHHYYKCESFGTYHVSSGGNNHGIKKIKRRKK